MYEPEWLAVVAMVLSGLLLIMRLAWPSSGERARRRQARATKVVAVDYRKERQNSAGAGRPVTVAELVERAAREERAARLSRRQGRDGWPGEADRPTEVLPPVR